MILPTRSSKWARGHSRRDAADHARSATAAFSAGLPRTLLDLVHGPPVYDDTPGVLVAPGRCVLIQVRPEEAARGVAPADDPPVVADAAHLGFAGLQRL